MIHGDAVPVMAVGRAGTKSLDVISWQSLLVYGQTVRVKMLAFSMFEQSKIKNLSAGIDSMARVWKLLVWSLGAMFSGKFPELNFDGTPFEVGSSDRILANRSLCSDTEPYFAVLWSIKGDIDWYGKGLGLKGHGRNEHCDYCPCSKDLAMNMWPTNFSPGSSWKSTRGRGMILECVFDVDETLGKPSLAQHAKP